MVNDKSKGALAANTIMPVLAIFAVGLRFVSRRIKSQPLQLDDWSSLIALVCAVAVCIEGIYVACTGFFGILPQDMTLEIYVRFKKILFADMVIVAFELGVVKLSVLLFYKRIFNSNHKFRLASNILLGIVIAWVITAFFGYLFCARGISTFWTTPPWLNPTQYTINFTAFHITIAVIDLLLDVLIISLPIPIIKNLHVVGNRKLSLMVVFMLGAFCMICSSVRLYYVYALSRFFGSHSTRERSLVDAGDLWSHIEACASIIAACLPTFGPLFALSSRHPVIGSARSFFSTWRGSVFSISGTSKKSTNKSLSNDSNKAWIELDSNGQGTTSIGGGDRLKQPRNERGIMVERTFGAQELMA